MRGLEERRVEWDVSLRDLVDPMRSGFKGHGSDVIIHPLGFCRHEKYLPRSVIITVALLWTPSYTRLATPLQSTVLFPSKDAAAIHLCVIIGSSSYEGWINENRRALHHERFLHQLYKRRAPCHSTFVTSPRRYHVNSSSRRSCYPAYSVASSVYFTCVTSHASLFMPYKAVGRQPFPHTAFKNGAPSSGCDQVCRQQSNTML